MNRQSSWNPMSIVTLIVFYLCACGNISAQFSPFAIINDTDGFTNIRYGKTKKIIDKLYDNQVFAIQSIVDEDGWQDWFWIEYPDFSLAKKPFEKFINKTKEGMIHKSRFTTLTDLPQWKKKAVGDETMILNSETEKLTICYGKFVENDHTYTKIGNAITKIDGSEPWGIDGYVGDSTIEIKSIILETDGQKHEFPKETIKNMLMPTKILANLGVAQSNENTIFLYMSNSDGAGSYDVVWTIRSGKVTSQFLYRNF